MARRSADEFPAAPNLSCGWCKRASCRVFSLLAFLLAFLPCTLYAQRAEVVATHPTVENIPLVTDERFILREEVVPESASFWISNEDSLSERAIVIDENWIKRDHYLTVSRADDVELDPSGRIYAANNNVLRVFHSDSSFLGGYEVPIRDQSSTWSVNSSVSVSEDGSTVVLLTDSSLVTVYTRTELGLTMEDSFVAASKGEQGCVLNSHFYHLGLMEGNSNAVHEYTLAGTYVRSFPSAYHSSNDLIRRLMLASGFLACSERAQTVVWVRSDVPVVHGFTQEGVLRWIVKLADFAPMTRIETVRPDGIRLISGRQFGLGRSSFTGLFTDGLGNAYVSYATLTRDSTLTSVHLFGIDATAGLGAYTGITSRIAAINRNSAVIVSAERNGVFDLF